MKKIFSLFLALDMSTLVRTYSRYRSQLLWQRVPVSGSMYLSGQSLHGAFM